MKIILIIAITLSAGFAAGLQGFEGQYQIQLKIGTHVFSDEMILQGENGQSLDRKYSGPVTGSISVPGAFTSDLNGELSCGEAFCELSFKITATENGESYDVFYRARTKDLDVDHPLFTGTARLADGSPLGTLTATRKELP